MMMEFMVELTESSRNAIFGVHESEVCVVVGLPIVENVLNFVQQTAVKLFASHVFAVYEHDEANDCFWVSFVCRLQDIQQELRYPAYVCMFSDDDKTQTKLMPESYTSRYTSAGYVTIMSKFQQDLAGMNVEPLFDDAMVVRTMYSKLIPWKTLFKRNDPPLMFETTVPVMAPFTRPLKNEELNLMIYFMDWFRNKYRDTSEAFFSYLNTNVPFDYIDLHRILSQSRVHPHQLEKREDVVEDYVHGTVTSQVISTVQHQANILYMFWADYEKDARNGFLPRVQLPWKRAHHN